MSRRDAVDILSNPWGGGLLEVESSHSLSKFYLNRRQLKTLRKQINDVLKETKK
jgi:hypothetical protein